MARCSLTVSFSCVSVILGYRILPSRLSPASRPASSSSCSSTPPLQSEYAVTSVILRFLRDPSVFPSPLSPRCSSSSDLARPRSSRGPGSRVEPVTRARTAVNGYLPGRPARRPGALLTTVQPGGQHCLIAVSGPARSAHAACPSPAPTERPSTARHRAT